MVRNPSHDPINTKYGPGASHWPHKAPNMPPKNPYIITEASNMAPEIPHMVFKPSKFEYRSKNSSYGARSR